MRQPSSLNTRDEMKDKSKDESDVSGENKLLGSYQTFGE